MPDAQCARDAMADKSSSVIVIPESDVSSDVNSEIEREELEKHQRLLNIERSVTKEREAFEEKFVSKRAKKIKDLQSLTDQYSQDLFSKRAEANAAMLDVKSRSCTPNVILPSCGQTDGKDILLNLWATKTHFRCQARQAETTQDCLMSHK